MADYYKQAFSSYMNLSEAKRNTYSLTEYAALYERWMQVTAPFRNLSEKKRKKELKIFDK